MTPLEIDMLNNSHRDGAIEVAVYFNINADTPSGPVAFDSVPHSLLLDKISATGLHPVATGAVDWYLPHFSITADRCGWISLQLGPSLVRGSSRVNTRPTVVYHICQQHF